MANTETPRSLTRPAHVGPVVIGGGAPIVVQSMTCTKTEDTEATAAQVRSLAEAGCDLVRVTLPHKGAVDSFAAICAQSPVPIVADIHFDYELAIAAARSGAAKLRINPGNIGSWDKVDAVIEAAGENGCAIRIGVNAGSLDKAVDAREGLTLPEKLVVSSVEFIRHFEARGFDNIVLSAKAHDVPTTIETYRALSRELPQVPLHLGVTEAGTPQQGTIKNAVALGVLLSDGIGDTLRVSLTADPVEEVPVAWGILQSLGLRRRGPELVSCPTCGRTQVNLIPVAEEVERRLRMLDKPISVAVMGCVVNGPGEAKGADVGVACGKGCALLFRPGQRHSYKALGESYSDFWAHIQSSPPLLYEGFPFGRPIPLAAPERFFALFSVMLGEFFSARRTRESVLSSLCSALVEMLSSEVELKGTLFYSFLALREDIFRSPECEWTAEGAAARLNLSKGYFHTLYKQYFGTTFLSDVIISRVQAAEDLLSSSQESVSRIAERCGYLNEEHFIRQFSQFTGTTPHRYRLKLKSQGAGKSSESVREL